MVKIKRAHNSFQQVKIQIFLIFVSMVLLIFGYRWGDRLGLMLTFLCLLTLHLCIFFFGQYHLLRRWTHRRLEGQDPWGLMGLIQEYSQKMNLPDPHLYWMESPVATAFTFGFSKDRGGICISRGLVDRLTPQEVEAVVVHQLEWIQALSTFEFGVVMTLTQVFWGLAFFLDTRIFKRKTGPFMRLFSPLFWILLRGGVRRGLFLENDQRAIRWTNNREALASALLKIESLNRGCSLSIPPCSEPFFIVDPRGLVPGKLMSSHPPVGLRVQRLMGHFPF